MAVNGVQNKGIMLQISVAAPQNAKTPTYATDGSACFDLYAATADGLSRKGPEYNYEFGTGLAFEIPENHVMLAFSRSGISFRENETLCNAVAVLDSDFRGEVKIKYSGGVSAGVGDRIAQALILPVERITFQVTDELTETERGQGGFGHTGMK